MKMSLCHNNMLCFARGQDIANSVNTVSDILSEDVIRLLDLVYDRLFIVFSSRDVFFDHDILLDEIIEFTANFAHSFEVAFLASFIC